MEFTYAAYKKMIFALREKQYKICNYHNYTSNTKSAILRHDVDYDLKKAVVFADFEKKIGISSTYFVLLSGDFYNLFSERNKELLYEIAECGHEVGLHFDETVYKEKDLEMVRYYMENEAAVLNQIVGIPVSVVSMHRPSKKILESDLNPQGLINSYGKNFFEDFKYVSDSRMHWREDIMEIIEEHKQNRLHILTHPFWYQEEEQSTENILLHFIEGASKDRYMNLDANFRDLDEYILCHENEIKSKKEGKIGVC